MLKINIYPHDLAKRHFFEARTSSMRGRNVGNSGWSQAHSMSSQSLFCSG
jgi:hypothetical protein